MIMSSSGLEICLFVCFFWASSGCPARGTFVQVITITRPTAFSRDRISHPQWNHFVCQTKKPIGECGSSIGIAQYAYQGGGGGGRRGQQADACLHDKGARSNQRQATIIKAR